MKTEIRKNHVYQGDCLEIMRQFPDCSVSAVLTDPPYGLSQQPDMREVLKHWLAGEEYVHDSTGFMSNRWDAFVPGPKVWEEVMRVLKPGGHILSFSGTRTYDLMVTAIRIAGAEVRDKFAYICDAEPDTSWVYGCLSQDTELLINGKWMHYSQARIGAMTLCFDIVTGEFKDMPIQEVSIYDYDETAYTIKSNDTDQIVSKNHRCLVGDTVKYEVHLAEELAAMTRDISVPILDENMRRCFSVSARIEPIHYTGKVWCVRVPTGAFVARRNGKVFVTGNSGFPKSLNISKQLEKNGHPELAKQFLGYGSAIKPSNEPIAIFGKSDAEVQAQRLLSDPLYYTAKAGSKERNFGCENLFWFRNEDGTLKEISKAEYDAGTKENEAHKDEKGYVAIPVSQGDVWPTIKPIELMRYLCRLVKMPSNNLILDPFLGSGTTALACIMEGCDFVGIERDPTAVKIAEARIKYWTAKAAEEKRNKNEQSELAL